MSADLWDDFDEATTGATPGLWDDFDQPAALTPRAAVPNAPSFAGVTSSAQTSALGDPVDLPPVAATIPDGFLGGLADIAANPIGALHRLTAPVARGIAGADLGGAFERGAVGALAGSGHALGDFIDLTVQQANPLPQIIEAGGGVVPDAMRDPLGARALADEALAVNREVAADRAAAMPVRPTMADVLATPDAALEQFGARAATMGAESAPLYAAALATRNPAIGSGVLGGVTGGQTFTDMRGQGLGRADAAQAAALTAMAEAAGEGVSLPGVMRPGPGGFAGAVLGEGGQEALVELAQTNIADQALGTETPIAEQLLGALDAAAVGGGLGGAGYVASNAPALLRRPAPAPDPAPAPQQPPAAAGPQPTVEPVAAPPRDEAGMPVEDDADLVAMVQNLLSPEVAAALGIEPEAPTESTADRLRAIFGDGATPAPELDASRLPPVIDADRISSVLGEIESAPAAPPAATATEVRTSQPAQTFTPEAPDPLAKDVERLAEYKAEIAAGGENAGFYREILEGHEKLYQRRRAGLDAYRETGDGTTMKIPGEDRWAMLLPDATTQGKYRFQEFDRRGFSSHSVFDTPEEAAIEMGERGYTERDADKLDELGMTPEWDDGMFASSVIQAMNSGQITWQEGNAKFKEREDSKVARAPLGESANQTPEQSGQASAPQSAPAGAGADLPTGTLYQRGNGRNKSSVQALQAPDGSWYVRTRKARQWGDWEQRDSFDPSPAFGYRKTATNSGQVRVKGVGAIPVDKHDASTDPVRQYNPLLDLVVGAGGVSRADARRMGVDPAEFKRRHGIRPIYSENGIPLDRLREMMLEEGYFPPEDPDAPPTIDLNDVWDQVGRAIGGDPVGPIGDPRMAELQRERYEDQQGDEDTSADLGPDDELAAWFDAIEDETAEPFAPGDETEAATIAELAERAAAAGVSDFDTTQRSNEPDAAYAARLWGEINRAEAQRGANREAEASDLRQRVRAGEAGQAAPVQDEPAGGFELGAPEPAAEATRREVAPSQGAGLFGAPTARDFIDARTRDRDDARNGRTGTGSTDMLAGDGELFAGPRPEQARVDEAAPDAATKLRNYGWDAVKLADAYTFDQLNELRAEVEAQHANPKDAEGHPVSGGQSTIHLYDKEGRRKLDKLAWAVTYKLQESKAAKDEAARKIAAGAPPPEPVAPVQRQPEPARLPRPAPEPAKPVQMTMAEWKAIHKDFKGKVNGQRSTMIDGRLVPVEIVKPEPTTEESSAVAATDPVQAQRDLFDRLREGSATLDEYKAGWEMLQANRDAIRGQLETMRKDALVSLAGARYRNENKAALVRSALSEMESDYAIGRGVSWSMGESLTNVYADMVESTTEADLKAYADRFAERRQAREQRIAGAKDPQTLSEFEDAARLAGGESKLSRDQRERFDALRVQARQEQREAAAKRNAEIRRVDTGDTGMELVESKHTQKGHDIFVVKMAERVDADTYKSLNAAAKRLGGYYSSYRGNGAIPGFTFTSRTAAEQFMAVREGNVDASAQQEARSAAKDDDRADTLAGKAARLREKAEASLNRDRKDNTARRAAQAASAEESARRELAIADTMDRIAEAIESGEASLLRYVRHRTQVDLLERLLTNAQWDYLRAQGVQWEKAKDAPMTAESLVDVSLPSFEVSRGDAVPMVRALLSTRGGKQLGQSVSKMIDYGDEYGAAVQDKPHRFVLGRSDGGSAIFKTKREADAALSRSADKVRGVVVKLPSMGWAVALSPELAIERKLWAPDYDKKVRLSYAGAKRIADVLGTGYGSATPNWWATNIERRAALEKLGIETNAEYREALREYLSLRKPPAEADRVKKLERDLAGRKGVGVDFFPTPPAVVERVIQQADIGDGMRVLEPSAGKGDIAEAIRDAAQDVVLDTVEMSPPLREILEAKGFDLVGHDFLEMEAEPTYDRIVMNPPFGTDNGASHVRHAYDLLKPGGRLVAVMGAGSRGKEAFDAWLEDVGGLSEALPEGSFKSSFRPTGVATQVVVIDKAGADALANEEPAAAHGSDEWHELLDEALQESGETVASSIDAEKRWNNGERLFAWHENTDEPSEVTSLAMLQSYAEDQLLALPRSVAAQYGLAEYRAADESTSTNTAFESLQQGEADAEMLGLRDAVSRVLGERGDDVIYLHGTAGLPDRLRRGIERRMEQRSGRGRTAALYDPVDQQVYLFTDVVTEPDRAVWNVLHEFAGHHGLRALLGDKLAPALEIALQNPTVKAVADAIAAERNIDTKTQAGRLLAAEEALAEMAAAVRTGDYDAIARRYSVDVPEGIRAKVARAIENFVARLKRLLDDLFGERVFTDEDVRELLEAAWQAANGNGSTAGPALESTAPDQTQTAAFRRWFGDSKVVDENGAPLVVYHGTNADFDAFNPVAEGIDGIYFSSDPVVAQQYADWRSSDFGGDGRLYSAYLAIRNPLVVEGMRDFDADAFQDAVDRAKDAGHDGVIVRNVRDGWNADAPLADTYIAFRPSQIKSATGNNGNFDPESDSILESVEATIAPDATGRSILADGRLLTVIDAAKAAGIDLADLIAAHSRKDAAGAVAAIDAILAELRKPPAAPLRSTGVKNAVTEAERAAANRDPILREAVKTNEATLYEAMRAVQGDPMAGPEAVARLSSGGVDGISLADEAVLLVHKTALLNKRDEAAKKLADPNASEAAKGVARRAWEEAEAQITAVDMAAVNAGREWGRFGQFRQRMLRADYTFEALERKERARLERPLTADESATIKAMAAKIEELQSKVDALQERVSNAASESAYEALTKRMATPLKQRRSLDYLRNAANDARARLAASQGVPSRRGQSGAIINPGVFADYAIIGAYHIANGAAKFSDWVSAMSADLGEAFDRFKAEHPNIFKAAQRELEKPLKADATVAEVLERIDPANIKPADVRKLVEALVGEGMRGEPAVIAAAAEHLALAEDEVRALFVQTAPRAEPTLTEAQEELRDLRKIVRLQHEIERLEAGAPKPARTPAAPDSPAVAAKKQELADLRASMRPQRDPEGRYQAMRGKQIEKRIAELQERIARGDFAKRPRVPRALSEANQRAMFELDKAKHEFLRHQFEDNLRRRTPIGKVLGGVADTFNLARAMMTSFDLSAILRQGGFISYGHPWRALKSVGPSLRAFASDQAEHRVKAEIESRPNAPLYHKYGLQLTGIGAGPLTQIEEAYASRWLERFPTWLGGGLVRGSGRAYTSFLNKLRADSFDAMAAALGRRSTLTEVEGKAIAGYINTATGRGKIGAKENAAQTLNTVFFAPRLVASRFQLLAGQPLYGGNARTRKMIVVEYARFLIGVNVAIALAAFALGEDEEEGRESKPLVGLDPRSSDFGKIRVGNTYLDPLAGLAQVTVLLARLTTGETVGSGDAKPLRPSYTLTDLRIALGEDIEPHELGKDGELPFGSGSAASVLGRFVRSKLAPVPGAIINALSGSNMIGEETTPSQVAMELVTPMSFQDIADVMAEHGIPKGSAVTVLGLLGMGIQHRDEPNPLVATDAARTDVKERLAALPMDQWASKLEEMRDEYGPVLDGVELAIYKRDGKYGNAGEPRRTADGLPVLETERLSDPERMRASYRELLSSQGLSPAAAARAMEKNAVHHIIPDNVVRQHPLMIEARTTAGYDLDNPGNLVGLTKERGPATDRGEELGHWTSHTLYDGKVVEELDKAMRRLRREYGTLGKAPRADVLDAVRKVEAAMRDKIERRDVPTKDGRLAAMGEGEGTAA